MRAVSSLKPADVEVNRWRREQLVLSGFSLPLAALIAGDPGYDLHRLIQLVEQGCPPELAVRILAPLEPREAA
ncbi:MAG TPA: hypothetical protein VJU01_04855 [Gaiellaceae bacterium]|nr:hypothetical protein [Gaiellaceae bacterium]